MFRLAHLPKDSLDVGPAKMVWPAYHLKRVVRPSQSSLATQNYFGEPVAHESRAGNLGDLPIDGTSMKSSGCLGKIGMGLNGGNIFDSSERLLNGEWGRSISGGTLSGRVNAEPAKVRPALPESDIAVRGCINGSRSPVKAEGRGVDAEFGPV